MGACTAPRPFQVETKRGRSVERQYSASAGLPEAQEEE